jgi:thiamine biosynthesis lipoprotein
MTTATDALESVQFTAWGTTAVVAVTEPAGLEPAREALEAVIEAFDLACSRFRDDSELAALSAAGGSPMQVSELLLEAVGEAIRGARVTDGDVDPTVGEALVALGYDRDFETMDGARSFSIARVPGWRTVELDREHGTVRVPRGVRLDLGATAKALAADRASRRAAVAAGCGALVALGGDLSASGPPPDGGWRVRVTDDHRAGFAAPGQWITLYSGGLATSSITARAWRAGEHPVHHLIDPASGWPAGGMWRTASVAAASCVDANIASTAAIVRGERAAAWLEGLELPSRLVSVDGHVRHLAGWPADGEDMPPWGTPA